MPISEYFKGSGEKVMKSMKKEYGAKKGKQVFYATANKQKSPKAAASGPSMRGMSHLPKGVSLTPVGDIGKHRGQEAYVLGTFSGCESMTAEKAGWQAMREHQQIDDPYRKFKGEEKQ